MPEYPQLVHLSVPELIGSAGGDPWKVDETIQAGAPGEISELAQSFNNAGTSVTKTSDEFARISVDLQNIAASLAEAQRSGHISISGLNGRLVQIDNTITTEIQKAKADGVALDWSALKTAAIDEVKRRLDETTAVRTAYGNELTQARVDMAAQGYDPAVTNGATPNPVASQPNGQPANLDDALDHIAGAPVPAAPTPVPVDPKQVEEFKARARPVLLQSGVPTDQIESRLTAMVARAERGINPYYRAPEPQKAPPPGFAEGFADVGFPRSRASGNCSARAVQAPPASSNHGVKFSRERPKLSPTRSVPR